jgi:hypothetical protein
VANIGGIPRKRTERRKLRWRWVVLPGQAQMWSILHLRQPGRRKTAGLTPAAFRHDPNIA